MAHTFKQGDRVIYNGTGHPNLQGQEATITELVLSQAYHIEFDGGYRITYVGERKLLPMGITVESALAFLRAKGKVTFEPKFEPIAVDTYIAGHVPVVSETMIKIGCTEVSFAKFDMIAKAVEHARQHNSKTADRILEGK